ncbi:MAG: CinA family protein [Chlamydiota bacterium]|jgi:PncC family amidohydrolase
MKEKSSEERTVQAVIGLCLLKESDVADPIKKIEEKYPYANFQIYFDAGLIKIRIVVSDKWRHDLEDIILEFKKKFPTNFFKGTLEACLQEAFVKKKKTLILAESCTGGTMASVLTSLPGSSAYFLGSIVSYANSIKERVLQVKPATLKEKGAVSKETVKEMLDGALALSSADYAAAVSGIAGPGGGDLNKPVGTVFIGLAKRGDPYQINTLFIEGKREQVIKEAVYTAFSYLYRKLEFTIDTTNE